MGELAMKQYKHYIIYKITNTINGKIYIGKHKCDDLDDNYFGSGKQLWLAINKYGLENFIFHMEIDLHNQEEMDLLEELVVNEDFLKRDDVYNISRGGKNPCMYGINNPFYGKDHSESFKRKVSMQFKGKSLTQTHKDNISKGLKKLLENHPEIKLKFGSRKNKKKCKNKNTGEVKFFNINDIPDDFEIYIHRKTRQHVSEEQKLENRRKQIERNKKSKWYTNGIEEKFCLPENVPQGFIPGRLPTTNVGRKYSKESRLKMRNAKLGKTPSNKGKVFITNGTDNKYVDKYSILPDGWKYGMTRKNRE